MGRSGSTHGESTESSRQETQGRESRWPCGCRPKVRCPPARRSRPDWCRRPIALSRSSPVVGNQRALRIRLQRAHVVLLRVEIDLEHDEVLVFRLAGELRQDRILRAADRAPCGEDIDEDRLAVFLRLGEGGGVEGLPLGGGGRKRAEQQNGREDGKEKRGASEASSDPSNKGCGLVAEPFKPLYQPGIAPGQSRSLEFGVSERRRAGAVARDQRKEGRDHRVPAGEGQPQEAPGGLVAMDDGRIDDAALAPLQLEGAGAFARARPPFPLDAGMVDAGRRIGEEGERDEDEQDAGKADVDRRARGEARERSPAPRNNRRSAPRDRAGTARSRRDARRRAQ